MHVHVSDHEQMRQLHQLLKYSREAMWHYLNATIFPATMKCVAPCGMHVLSVLTLLGAFSWRDPQVPKHQAHREWL